MRAASHESAWLLALLVTASTCVAPPPPPPSVREFEHDAQGGEVVGSYTAAGGLARRLAATTSQVVVPAPEPGPGGGVRTLWLRVAAEGEGAIACELAVRGGGASQSFKLAPTGHRERFEWWALPVAAQLLDSAAAAPLELSVTGPGELRLDQFAWGSGAPPPSASPPVWRAGQLEVRAGFDAEVGDPDWVLHLLGEQYAAVARLCGRDLAGPVVLVALAPDQWPQAETGAFQNGCVIFLRERELHLPWRGFAHELAHLFEEQSGAGRLVLPHFWSEGFACAVADEVDAQLFERGVPRARVRWRRLLESGDEFHAAGSSALNRAIGWPDAAGKGGTDRRAYEWAGAVVDALAEIGGAGYFRRLETQLAGDADALRAALAAAPDDAARVAIAAAPFLAAAGPKGTIILRSAGIPFPGALGESGGVGGGDQRGRSGRGD